MTVFIDTSVLFAAAVSSDGRHDVARAVLGDLGDEPQITTDHVVVETWNLLAARRGRAVAMRFWEGLRFTPVSIVHVTEPDMERAESVAREWPDQDLDIVDCSSFAVMERLGCYRAATFDEHFAIYRTGPERTRAFDIVRAR